jgi:hypothetical protein
MAPWAAPLACPQFASIKSALALQLALARKLSGREVLLVDADAQGTAQTAVTLRSEAAQSPSLTCVQLADWRQLPDVDFEDGSDCYRERPAHVSAPQFLALDFARLQEDNQRVCALCHPGRGQMEPMQRVRSAEDARDGSAGRKAGVPAAHGMDKCRADNAFAWR